MRFSFESRCRIVVLIIAGASPQASDPSVGALTWATVLSPELSH